MKLTQTLLALATVFSISPRVFAESYELKVKVTTRVGSALLASGRNQRVFAIVCGGLRSWSADLVFPVQNSSGVPELTLETYRRFSPSMSAASEKRSAYRPFSTQDAADICSKKGEFEYTLLVTENDVKVTGTKAIVVQSVDVGRADL